MCVNNNFYLFSGLYELQPEQGTASLFFIAAFQRQSSKQEQSLRSCERRNFPWPCALNFAGDGLTGRVRFFPIFPPSAIAL